MGFISIWVAIFFAYHYVKFEIEIPIMAAVDTAVTFMLVAGSFVDTEEFTPVCN